MIYKIHTLQIYMCVCMCLCLCLCIKYKNGVYDCKRVVAPTKQFYGIFMRWCIHFISSSFLSLSLSIHSFYFSLFLCLNSHSRSDHSYGWFFSLFIQETKFIFVNTPRIFCYALCSTRDKLAAYNGCIYQKEKERKNKPSLNAMATIAANISFFFLFFF